MNDFKYGSDISTEVKLLHDMICYHDPLKKAYKGYNFEEIKTCFYNDIKINYVKNLIFKKLGKF